MPRSSRASRLVLPAIAVALFVVPLSEPGEAVYGGTEAAEGAYPFMVHVFIGEPHDGIVCGGSLVAPTFVLTAGHCLPSFADDALGPNLFTGGEDLEDYRVVIGRVDLSGTGGEVIAVKAGHLHPEYNIVPYNHGAVAAANDIALLELAEPSSYAPARPATNADLALYAPGTEARVLGWGCTPEVCFPERLMEVDVPVWSDAECAAASNYAVMFHADSELCAGSDGKDSCGGDSGGPLFVRDEAGDAVVFGVVSYGALFEVNTDDPFAGFVPCGSDQHPGVYTEVAAFEDFLMSFLG